MEQPEIKALIVRYLTAISLDAVLPPGNGGSALSWLSAIAGMSEDAFTLCAYIAKMNALTIAPTSDLMSAELSHDGEQMISHIIHQWSNPGV